MNVKKEIIGELDKQCKLRSVQHENIKSRIYKYYPTVMHCTNNKTEDF